MIKIEAITLEEAYENAASSLKCSVTELKIEVVQYPSRGILGLFKKSAVIVATKDIQESPVLKQDKPEPKQDKAEPKQDKAEPKQESKKQYVNKKAEPKEKKTESKKSESKKSSHTILNDTIMPASFVSTQDDDEDEIVYEPVYADDEYEEDVEETPEMSEIAQTVKIEMNKLFDLTCFKVEEVEVSVYDENTLLVELKGEDAALLIGKEGYRYKALSYMIFNWINSKYQVQLRLEIAEFLKNQEEAVSRYLEGVYESVDRDGRAQTKILDGVLVQIALKELRERYQDKYVAIRSTRDGMKYIIINDYHSN